MVNVNRIDHFGGAWLLAPSPGGSGDSLQIGAAFSATNELDLSPGTYSLTTGTLGAAGQTLRLQRDARLYALSGLVSIVPFLVAPPTAPIFFGAGTFALTTPQAVRGEWWGLSPGRSNNTACMTAALASLPLGSKLKLGAGTYTFESDCTIGAAGLLLDVSEQPVFKPASGVTLTFEGENNALDGQVLWDLSAGGSVVVGASVVRMGVALAPEAGVDNSPRVQAAAEAVGEGGRVFLLNGTWQWDTPCQLVRGVTYECQGRGVEIVSSITPTPINGHLQSVFNYDGFDNGPNPHYTSTAGASSGTRTIVVADATGIAVDTEILIREGDSTQGQQSSAHIVRAISGLTLTIDRPLIHTFTSSSSITTGTTAKDIRLIGNGARIRGTGDRAISLVSAWHSYAEGWELDGPGFTDYTFSFDTGSFQSGYEWIVVRDAGVIGMALEACEDCYRAHCYTENCAFMFQAAYNTTEEDCHANGHGIGAGIYIGWLNDSTGSRGVRLIGCSYVGFEVGVYVGGSSQDVDVIACDLSSNASHAVYVAKVSPSLVPGRVRVQGGEIRNNGGSAFVVNGARGCSMRGVFTENNGSGARVTNGGELTIDGCRMYENNPGEQFVFLTQDATTRLRVLDTYIKTVSALSAWSMVNVQGTANVTLKGVDFDFSGGGDGAAVYVSGAASVYVEDCANVGSAISNGVVAAAAGAVVRRGPNADFTNTTLPYVATSGGIIFRDEGDSGCVSLTANLEPAVSSGVAAADLPNLPSITLPTRTGDVLDVEFSATGIAAGADTWFTVYVDNVVTTVGSRILPGLVSCGMFGRIAGLSPGNHVVKLKYYTSDSGTFLCRPAGISSTIVIEQVSLRARVVRG